MARLRGVDPANGPISLIIMTSPSFVAEPRWFCPGLRLPNEVEVRMIMLKRLTLGAVGVIWDGSGSQWGG